MVDNSAFAELHRDVRQTLLTLQSRSSARQAPVNGDRLEAADAPSDGLIAGLLQPANHLVPAEDCAASP